MISEGDFIRAACICCLGAGLGACGHTYVSIAQDFDVCGKSQGVGTFKTLKGIDFDEGTVTYEGSAIHVYIGRHPNVPEFNVNVSKLGSRIELLQSGVTKDNNQYKSVYGYRDEENIGGVKTQDTVFVVLSAADNSTNRKVISTVGANLVRCR